MLFNEAFSCSLVLGDTSSGGRITDSESVHFIVSPNGAPTKVALSHRKALTVGYSTSVSALWFSLPRCIKSVEMFQVSDGCSRPVR